MYRDYVIVSYILSLSLSPVRLRYCSSLQDGDPVKVGVPVTDLTMGLYAHGAIMAALMDQQRSGLGQKIDCNLLSSQVCACASHCMPANLEIHLNRVICDL